jgi:hypothetical protein
MSGSMLGLISMGPSGDAEAQERRAELVPATAGEVLGAAMSEGFQESPGPRMARVVGRGYVDTGDGNYAALNALDEFDMPSGLLPPSPMVPLEQLKREYEIPGVLKFDKDTPQSVAQSLYDHKRNQMARQDAIRRADNMLTSGMAARFAASMIGSIADPVNIAAMFVPGLNEATVARMVGVGAGAGALARAGVRAGAGATAGAAGMLALEPLNYALMGQERDDWTMAGALANVLFGTVAGAGLHSGLGALAERTRGLPDWAPARIASERFQAASPEVQDAVVRSAMAATVEGRPVDVSNLLDLHTALEREAAALRGEAAAVPTSGYDPVTIERLQAISAEMEAPGLNAVRRGELEAEMAMLTEGANRDAVALEQARSEAQRQGLEIAAARTDAKFAEIDRQLEEATRPASAIMRDIEAAQRPDPRMAEPPSPARRTDLPPPEPKPLGEPSAIMRDVAEIEKQTAALDSQIRMQEVDGASPMADRIKEYDALVDEETKVDKALFEAAAACIVRTR